MTASGQLEDVVHISNCISESMTSSYSNMTMNSFRVNMEKDVWCAWIDQVWLEFTVVQNSFARSSRTLPLMESFPLAFWLYQFPPNSKSDPAETPSLSPTDSEWRSLPHDLKSHVTEKLDSKMTSIRSHADFYLLMNIDVRIQLQIDHERYSFLMNLVETVARVSEEMEADFKNITGKTVTPQRVVLAAIVKEVEVSLLCPPSSRDLSSRLTSPDETGNSSGPLSDAIHENTAGSRLTLSEYDILDPGSKYLAPCDESEPLTGPTSLGDHSFGYATDLGNHPMSLLEEDTGQRLFIGNGSTSIALSGSRSQSPDSVLGGQSLSAKLQSLSRDSSSFSGLKKAAPEKLKSLNQAFSTLTSKFSGPRNSLKRSTASSRSDDSGLDGWDSMSVTSGSLSDDDEDAWQGFEGQAELPAFEWKGMTQDDSSIAEAESDDTSSGFTARLNKKLVTVITVNIGEIEAVVQSRGKEMSAKASVGNFAMTEGGNMEMERFFQLVSSGSKEFTNWPPKSSESRSIISARFDIGQQAEKLEPTSREPVSKEPVSKEPACREPGLIRALVNGIKMKLRTSTLKNISELFEDNKPSPPNFLMNATLSNIDVTIVDDKMPMYLPEPKNTTIDLFLHRAVITRERDGVFQIGDLNPTAAVKEGSLLNEHGGIFSSYSRVGDLPKCSSVRNVVKTDASTETDVMSSGKSSLESENDRLRRQLEKIGKMPCCRKECNDLQTKCKTLETLEAENQDLRREMENQMTQLLLLKEEREALLTVVQQLQDDLLYSERMRSRPMS